MTTIAYFIFYCLLKLYTDHHHRQSTSNLINRFHVSVVNDAAAVSKLQF